MGCRCRRCNSALVKTPPSAHIMMVDRRTDDLAAPHTWRPAPAPENPMRIRQSALCAEQQAGAHICN